MCVEGQLHKDRQPLGILGVQYFRQRGHSRDTSF